jgi:putative glutamine amidotransferase
VRLEAAEADHGHSSGTGVDPWVLGVQWHPEWHYAENPDSIAIFRAFGDACRLWNRNRP